MPKLIFAPLLFTVSLFAQLTSNSVTVTASRASNPQPDQVLFSVNVAAPVEATLTDVLAAIQGTGLTLANFTGIGFSGQSPSGPATIVADSRVQWGFSLPAALSDMKSTVGLLTAVQANLAKTGRFGLSFTVAGLQVSDRLRQSQNCAISDLIADAREQAQKLASSAGMSLGSILAMSTATTTQATSTFLSSGSQSATGPGPLPVCSLSVKFALGSF
jgi:hypothetical protein